MPVIKLNAKPLMQFMQQLEQGVDYRLAINLSDEFAAPDKKNKFNGNPTKFSLSHMETYLLPKETLRESELDHTRNIMKLYLLKCKSEKEKVKARNILQHSKINRTPPIYEIDGVCRASFKPRNCICGQKPSPSANICPEESKVNATTTNPLYSSFASDSSKFVYSDDEEYY
jgi:hypothetical protein